MIHSVAVIGIGAMGAPMARRIQGAGFALTVCDRNEAALAPFSRAGASVTAVPADCAAADLVLVVVATPEQVNSVVLGPQGVAAGLSRLDRPHAPLLAVMSTVPAESIKALAQAVPTPRLRLIDAPVSGGVPRAEQGTLTILTGGETQDIEAAAPVFSCLGTHQFHCGAVGGAQTLKIINNILAMANAAVAGEAYRLALEQGLDLAHVAQVFDVSTGRNFLSADPAGPRAAYAAMVPDPAGFAALSAIMRKDLGLAVDLAAQAPGKYPVIRGLKALIDRLGDETYEHWRRIAGLPVDKQ